MKPQYDHNLLSSFCLWLDHQILDKGEAYTNIQNSGFYREGNVSIEGNSLTSYNASQTQWVSDSSITGATIPSGVTVNGNFISTGTSGLRIDFLNGRIFVSGQNNTVVGSFAKKDFNIYPSNQHSTQLFLDRAFNGDNVFVPRKGSSIDSFIAPCILVSENTSENQPFAFGGQDTTQKKYSLVSITDNYYNLVGVNSILRDSNEICFPMVSFEDIPFNNYGGLKNGIYSYKQLDQNLSSFNNKAHIRNVRVEPIAESRNNNQGSFFVSFAEFIIEDYRNPRA